MSVAKWFAQQNSDADVDVLFPGGQIISDIVTGLYIVNFL